MVIEKNQMKKSNKTVGAKHAFGGGALHPFVSLHSYMFGPHVYKMNRPQTTATSTAGTTENRTDNIYQQTDTMVAFLFKSRSI